MTDLAPSPDDPVPPIVLYGQTILQNRAHTVDQFDATIHRIVEQMFATMAAAPGVGLAAPQIGLALRIFVYDCGPGQSGHVINPVLERLPGGLQDGDEGCLSLPGLAYPTPRAARVLVSGQDQNGARISIEGEDLLARCLQHETDHLDGILYIERLGGRTLKRAQRDARSADWWGQPVRRPTP
jgi:peptide deformylase